MNNTRVSGMAADVVRFAHESIELETIRYENERSWPNPKFLQMIFEKYRREYEFETFRKEILPNLYPEIFDMIFNRKKRNLEAVFKLKGYNSVKGIHEEVSSPIYLRKFSEVFNPYINREIDAILGYFGTSYDEYVEQYQKEIESDQEMANLIAFEYSIWVWETSTVCFSDAEEEEGDVISSLVTYHCDIATADRHISHVKR